MEIYMTIRHLVKGLLTCLDGVRWFALLCALMRCCRAKLGPAWLDGQASLLGGLLSRLC